MKDNYYSIRPDIAVINLNDGNILLKSEYISTRLEGASADFFANKILPLLKGNLTANEITSELKDISSESLINHLDKLVDTGILIRSERKKFHDEKTSSIPKEFANLLGNLNITDSDASELFAAASLTIIGANEIATALSRLLVNLGIGTLTLVDPDFVPGKEVRKNDLLVRELDNINKKTKIIAANTEYVKSNIEDIIKDSEFVVVDVDRGHTAIKYWVNEFSVLHKVPVLYTSVNGHVCSAGPLVIPTATPCYMCSKMRELSNEDNFRESMAVEKFYNDMKKSGAENSSSLPSLPLFLAGVSSNEVIKYILQIKADTLASRILEFDGFTLSQTIHPVLFKADCPVCQKTPTERKHYSLSELSNSNLPVGNLKELKPLLVDSKSGVIKILEVYHKDSTEPVVPYIIRADISNHNFHSKDDEPFELCSGKGLSIEEAEISAMGEAMERYSGSRQRKGEIFFQSYDELNVSKLDPRKLVLYQSGQYDKIEYTPFNPATNYGWVQGFSLTQNVAVAIPALAVFMNYNCSNPSEFLFQATSNGLAAGKTLSHAILSAALEVIERDSFLITWHNELQVKKINPLSLPDARVIDFVRSYQRRGVEMELYKLPTDMPCHVFMAVGYQETGDGPAACVGLGADFSAVNAARGALLEVGQVRPALKKRMRLPETKKRLAELLNDPTKVDELSDHDLLYSDPSMLNAFDFLRKRKAEDIQWQDQLNLPEQNLSSLVNALKNIGSDLIYYNLSAPEFNDLGTYAARVILPDFQPIHFGAKRIRLGGERMFELPKRLGLKKVVSLSNLNYNPHPLA